jgi:hypothetical protein
VFVGRYDRLRRAGPTGELGLGQASASPDMAEQLSRAHGKSISVRLC